jgi:hypothetical protein
MTQFPGPPPAPGPPEPAWQPANDAELAMAQALAANDPADYFRILCTATLYLPQFAAPAEVGIDPGQPGQGFVTADLFGFLYLPVFTSVQALAARLGQVAGAYTLTNYAELRRKWPDPTWRLAINPGTPIDAYTTIELVEDAALGEVPVPTAVDLIVDALATETEARTRAGSRPAPTAGPAPDTDAALTAARARNDPDGYLRAVLDAVVLVPTARPVTDTSELFEPGFPWRRAGTGPVPVIEVFTSEGLLGRAYPVPVPRIAVSVPYLLTLWPAGHALSINPRSDLAIELTPEQIPTLLLYGASVPDDD